MTGNMQKKILILSATNIEKTQQLTTSAESIKIIPLLGMSNSRYTVTVYVSYDKYIIQ